MNKTIPISIPGDLDLITELQVALNRVLDHDDYAEISEHSKAFLMRYLIDVRSPPMVGALTARRN